MFQKNRGRKPGRSIPWPAGAAIGLALLLAGPAAEGAETFNFRGDRMETILIGGRERIRLSGDARIDSEEYTIRAREIELYGQDYAFAQCRGDVQVTNRERGIEITSDELLYDRKRKTTRMQGNAMMVDRKNEMVIKGSLIEDWEERQETLIQIGVRILKTDLVCRAEFARYLREPETVELSGMPFVRWKGDEYQATKIFVDLKNDRIRLEGDIRGKVIQDAAEEDEDERARPGSEP